MPVDYIDEAEYNDDAEYYEYGEAAEYEYYHDDYYYGGRGDGGNSSQDTLESIRRKLGITWFDINMPYIITALILLLLAGLLYVLRTTDLLRSCLSCLSCCRLKGTVGPSLEVDLVREVGCV
jgi:hypothetical protein